MTYPDWAPVATKLADGYEKLAADPARRDSDREVAATYAERLREEAASERAIATERQVGGAA